MITFDKDGRPGVSALLTTAALCTGRSEVEIAEEIGNDGAGALKKYVTESVNNYLAPIRERRRELEGKKDYVLEVLHEAIVVLMRLQMQRSMKFAKQCIWCIS